MLINRIIINSSPLIVLFKSQQAELLPQLFTEILVPEGVFEEVTQGREEDIASRQLSTVPWQNPHATLLTNSVTASVG
jgi:predicted nucleic acid-binding protein